MGIGAASDRVAEQSLCVLPLLHACSQLALWELVLAHVGRDAPADRTWTPLPYGHHSLLDVHGEGRGREASASRVACPC